MNTVPTPAPFRMGHSLSRAPIGPLLVYCPTANSMNNNGILKHDKMKSSGTHCIIKVYTYPQRASIMKYGTKNAPPPDLYALQGNLQMFPRPTAYPMQARRKDILEPQVSLSKVSLEVISKIRDCFKNILFDKSCVLSLNWTTSLNNFFTFMTIKIF